MYWHKWSISKDNSHKATNLYSLFKGFVKHLIKTTWKHWYFQCFAFLQFSMTFSHNKIQLFPIKNNTFVNFQIFISKDKMKHKKITHWQNNAKIQLTNHPFFLCMKPKYLEKKHRPAQVTDKLYHIMLYQVHLAMSGIQTNSFRVAIGIDCRARYQKCDSNFISSR
jgi:hypothetical protein